jgi:hypothetical protein
VVVLNVAAMGETVVPVLVPLHWRRGAAWGLISPIPTAVAIVAVIPTSTAVCIAAATTTVVVAATAIVVAATATTVVVAATATVAATIAAAVVSTTLLAAAVSILGAPWLFLGGLANADCLAGHLKLSLDCRNVGGIRS